MSDEDNLLSQIDENEEESELDSTPQLHKLNKVHNQVTHDEQDEGDESIDIDHTRKSNRYKP